MIKDYFFLALGNLKHRGLRSWLTILGVFIGIAAVVALISLGNGLQEAITGQFASLDVDKLIIENSGTGFGPPGSTVIKKLNEHDLDLVKSVNGVDEAIIRIVRVVKVDYNKISSFEYIVDIPENSRQIEIILDSFNVELEEGRFLTEEDSGKIVLGNDFLENGKNRFGKEIHTGSKIQIQGEEFEVVGILEKGSSFQVNSVVFMTNSDLKNLLNIDDEIDLIVVQVSDKDEIKKVASEIERKLRDDRNLKVGEEDFSVQTPLQAVAGVNTVLNIVNLIVVGIAGISLLIGGIGIANTMYTSVLERTKEIGVMKSIGARNKDIMFIFLIESGLLGLVGGTVGALFGLGLALLISNLAGNFLGGVGLLVQVSYPLLFAAIGFSFLIGVLSGLIPAYQASKLNTVDALRGGR